MLLRHPPQLPHLTLQFDRPEDEDAWWEQERADIVEDARREAWEKANWWRFK